MSRPRIREGAYVPDFLAGWANINDALMASLGMVMASWAYARANVAQMQPIRGAERVMNTGLMWAGGIMFLFSMFRIITRNISDPPYSKVNLKKLEVTTGPASQTKLQEQLKPKRKRGQRGPDIRPRKRRSKKKPE